MSTSEKEQSNKYSYIIKDSNQNYSIILSYKEDKILIIIKNEDVISFFDHYQGSYTNKNFTIINSSAKSNTINKYASKLETTKNLYDFLNSIIKKNDIELIQSENQMKLIFKIKVENKEDYIEITIPKKKYTYYQMQKLLETKSKNLIESYTKLNENINLINSINSLHNEIINLKNDYKVSKVKIDKFFEYIINDDNNKIMQKVKKLVNDKEELFKNEMYAMRNYFCNFVTCQLRENKNKYQLVEQRAIVISIISSNNRSSLNSINDINTSNNNSLNSNGNNLNTNINKKRYKFNEIKKLFYDNIIDDIKNNLLKSISEENIYDLNYYYSHNKRSNSFSNIKDCNSLFHNDMNGIKCSYKRKLMLSEEDSDINLEAEIVTINEELDKKQDNYENKEDRENQENTYFDNHEKVIKLLLNSLEIKKNQTNPPIQITQSLADISTQASINSLSAPVKISNSQIKLDESANIFPGFTNEIITTKKELEIINSFLLNDYQEVNNNKKNYTFKAKFIYSGKHDGDSIEAFHSKCDSVSPTLCLILTYGNKKFGGFTNATWNVENGNYKADPLAFIFSLDNGKFYRTANQNLSIYPQKDSLLAFGKDDLFVADNFLGSGGCNDNYNDDEISGRTFKIQKRYELNDGDRFFHIKELEVYQIIVSEN